MTTRVTLTKVGNSKAFIIPAKILAKMNIDENSSFELTFGNDSTLLIRKNESTDNLIFPKIQMPEISSEEMIMSVKGLLSFSKEELDEDERLSYILRK